MKLYSIHYKGDENNLKTFEGVTDNFEKWLEEHNSHREEDCQERADNFEVKEISLYLYNKVVKTFKIYTDDTREQLVGNDIDTALEILENNGYIIEVKYEND